MENNLYLTLVDKVKNLESGESFSIILSDDSSFDIGKADCWVGGDADDGYMCGDLLGNVAYHTAERLITDIVNAVEKEMKLEIVDID